VAERVFVSATYTAFGFALKATGVFLLFTGEAKRWFAAQRYAPRFVEDNRRVAPCPIRQPARVRLGHDQPA
jgi:hypothetical protein